LGFAWFAGAVYLSFGILFLSLSAPRNGTALPFCPTDPPFPFQNVVPYIVIHIIFGLMWWLREITIQSEVFIERAGSSLQLTPAGSEGTCGWASLRDSQSGRLQASDTRIVLVNLLQTHIQSSVCCTDFQLYSIFGVS
jgi:hypothetical protein